MEIRTTASDGSTTFAEYNPPKLGDPCCHCRERPGTVEVQGIPGGATYWCELCLVRVQLEHAIGEAAQIPALKAALARLIDG